MTPDIVFTPARFAPHMTCVLVGDEPIGMIVLVALDHSASSFKAKSTLHTTRKGLAVKFILTQYTREIQKPCNQLKLF